MKTGHIPVRLLAEIVGILVLVETGLMLLLPEVAPHLKGLSAALLDALTLVLVSAPAIYWRSMRATRAAALARLATADGISEFEPRPVDTHERRRRTAVLMTAAAQCTGLAVTAAAVVWTQSRLDREAHQMFDRQVERLETEVTRRLRQPLNGLKGARAVYAASSEVRRNQFSAFVDARTLAADYPGVLGIGFIQPVQRAALPAFIDATRADGMPDFQVRSSGDAADLYIIKFIEPLAPNSAALGYDIGSEPLRRAAAESAVATGEATLTPAIQLVQDNKREAGFVMMMPVYRRGTEPATAEQRRQVLVGLVYAPFALNELLHDAAHVADGLLDFELFDGDGTLQTQLVYDADGHLGQADQEAVAVDAARFAGRSFHTVRNLPVGGRLLTMHASTTPAFDAAQDRRVVGYIGFGGALLSCVMALAVWSLSAGRIRALRLAQRMTADIERLAKVVRHTSNGVTITDRDLRITWVNEGFTRITGFSADEAIGRTPGELLGSGKADPAVLKALQDSAEAGTSCRVEILNRAKDGQEFWIDTEIQPLHDAQGQVVGFMEIGSDVTDKRLARQQLTQERQRLDNILRGTDVGTLEWHIPTGEIRLNERWAQMIGCTLAELAPITLDTWLSRMHPEDQRRADALLRRHFKGESDYFECEIRARHQQGHWVWLLCRGQVISRSEDGRPLWMAGTQMDITERKRAEQALRRANERMRVVIENLPCGLSVFDGELDMVACNTEFKQLLNLPERLFEGPVTRFESIIRHNAEQGEYGPGDITLLVAGIVERARHPVVHHFERTRPDGTVLEVRGVPLPGGGFVTTYTNVTERKQAEAAVHESEHLMRLVMDNIPGRLTYFDRQRRLKFANKASYDFYGGSPDTSRGASFTDFVGPAFAAQQAPRVDAALAGQGQSYDFVRDLPNGGKSYSVVHLIPDTHDGAVAGFIGMAIDVSAVKRAEQEVRRAEALLRGAIDAVNEAFVLYDADDRLVFCNDKYRELYATSADLIVPGNSFEHIVRAGAERGQYQEAVGRVDAFVAERVAAHRQGDLTLEQQLDDGRWLRVVERKMPDGHIVGFRIDITDLKNATQAAEQASRSKSQFLANMSHEIRTPMNAILGMLKLLHNTPLTPRQLDYADKTERAARALLALLNDILDFSKVEAGKMELDPRPFRLDRVMRDLSVILSANLGSKPVEVLFDIDPAVPRALVGDDMRLHQVLINLGGNAIKFTQAGEVVVGVRVLAVEGGIAQLEFSVRDTGIGIAPEHQQHIFSGFSQAEASTTRRFGGTGLGLSICQRLVALMGGSMRLDSAPGQGSRFSFTLGLKVADEAEAAGLVDARARARPADTAALRVLVIDDNPAAREVLAMMSRSLGWTVDLASGGAEALVLMQQQAEAGAAYQAVFVDWQMPGMDGWETSQRIRALAGEAAPLVLMVTAHGRSKLAERTNEEQSLLNGFLVKPVTASMLLDAVVDARAERGEPHLSMPAAPRDGRPRLQGLRLLVVEDNANNQQVAQELLEDEGALITLAADGQQGVDAVAQASPPFDAVLMDVQMPVMDGYTATSHIRQQLGLSALPIIAMTANALASDRAACLAAGMNDHVGKPFDLDELVAALQRHTGHRPAERPPAAEVAPRSARAGVVLPDDLVDEARALGIDLAAAVSRLSGRADVYARTAESFAAELGTLPDTLASLLQQGQRPEASRLMHTLKGMSATLGANALSALAAEAERSLGAAAQDAAIAAPAAADVAATGAAVGAATNEATSEATSGAEQAAWPPRIREAACAVQQALAGLVPRLRACLAPPAEPPPNPRDNPLETAKLRGQLDTLMAMLRDTDMAATDVFCELQDAFGETESAALSALGEAMASLDFEAALRECQVLAQAWAA